MIEFILFLILGLMVFGAKAIIITICAVFIIGLLKNWCDKLWRD